ncbi:transcription factor [Clostridium sp.]|jgi:hypothetical protein|uniref:transcription factor n=1 Tax=Clostridium sp. TaxID=1506 RepID=UPI0039F5C491
MKHKYNTRETLTGLLTIVGMLSIPVVVIKDKIKSIKTQEEEKRAVEKIMKYSMELEENLTNKNVARYIRFIEDIDVPNKIMCKNIIIETYKLVKDSTDIDDSLKADLRILLECKGVNFLY